MQKSSDGSGTFLHNYKYIKVVSCKSIYTPGFFLYLQVKMSADDITRVDVTVTSKECVINFNKLVEQKY